MFKDVHVRLAHNASTHACQCISKLYTFNDVEDLFNRNNGDKTITKKRSKIYFRTEVAQNRNKQIFLISIFYNVPTGHNAFAFLIVILKGTIL